MHKILDILYKTDILINGNVNISRKEYEIYNSILNTCKMHDDENNKSCIIAQIDFSDLEDIMTKENVSYKEIECVIKKLLFTFIEIEEDYHIHTTLVNGIKTQETCIELILNRDLYNILSYYRNTVGISLIELTLVNNITRRCTQKLYELLVIYKDKKEINISLEDLMALMKIEADGSYKTYANFKNRILVPSIFEIREKLNTEIIFEEIKTRQKITDIKFTVNKIGTLSSFSSNIILGV